MPASLRIKPLDRTVMFQPGGALDPATAARQVAAFARDQVAQAETIDAEALGHDVTHTDFVNGLPSQDYEAVKPGQSIVAVFDLGTDALQWILDMLILAAPYLTGQFKRSITIYADGEPVDSVAAAANASEVVFLPLVPYGRKIERGQSPQAPEGVFQGVAALAAARYGNQASIKFSFREPTGGANELETWARKHSAKAGWRQRRQYSVDVRQPAIVVTLR